MLKKKLLVCGLTLFLFACGNDEATGEESKEQESSELNIQEVGPIPLSKAFETNPVWFRLVGSDAPDRSTRIHSVYYYNEGEVTVYPLNVSSIFSSEFEVDPEYYGITLEESLEYSDEELINILQDTYQEFVESGMVDLFEEQSQKFKTDEFSLFSQESRSEAADIYLDYLYEQVESEEYKELLDNSSDYTIDTTLDGSGNQVKSQTVIFDKPSVFESLDSKGGYNLSLGAILNTHMELVDVDSGEARIDEEGLQEYSSRLTEPVSDSITLEYSSQSFAVFDATFSGYLTDSGGYFVTRGDEPINFNLDGTDVSNPNVTIEGEPTQ